MVLYTCMVLIWCCSGFHAKRECRIGVFSVSLRTFDAQKDSIFEDHKSSAHRQFQVLKGFSQDLPHGHAVTHLDYKQSPTIPLGPDEPGTWWFATARGQVTVFGAHIHAHSETSTEENPCTLISYQAACQWSGTASGGGPADTLRTPCGYPDDEVCGPDHSAHNFLHWSFFHFSKALLI